MMQANNDAPAILVASQWRLMWWKFRKHHLAVLSLVVVIFLYSVAIFAGFFAPKATDTFFRGYVSAPPQTIYWFDEDGNFAPYVHAWKLETDPMTYQRTFTEDTETKIQLGFFV